MRHWHSVLFAAIIFAIPLSAQAGFILEGSLGSGYLVKPEEAKGRIPTNIMLAPGYGLGEWLRAELGLLAALGDVEDSDFDVELRPMLVVAPPLFPLYARAIFAVTNLASDLDTGVAYGGALGISFSLLGLGAFAEAGVVPHRTSGETYTIIEGRLGAYYAF